MGDAFVNFSSGSAEAGQQFPGGRRAWRLLERTIITKKRKFGDEGLEGSEGSEEASPLLLLPQQLFDFFSLSDSTTRRAREPEVISNLELCGGLLHSSGRSRPRRVLIRAIPGPFHIST